MWRFGFPKAKAWPQPSRSLLFLLFVLQITFWYPVWQSQQSNQQAASVQESRLKGKSTQQQAQNRRLTSGYFDSSRLLTQVMSRHKGTVTQWSISGKMPLPHWQALQESMQEQVALGLVDMSWLFSMDGDWQGKLLFDVLAPRSSQTMQDWLPVGRYPLPKTLAQWGLVFVVVEQGEASALLSYRAKKRWVRQGDWLPELGLSVARIVPKQVTLRSLSGEKLTLLASDFNGMKE